MLGEGGGVGVRVHLAGFPERCQGITCRHNHHVVGILEDNDAGFGSEVQVMAGTGAWSKRATAGA